MYVYTDEQAEAEAEAEAVRGLIDDVKPRLSGNLDGLR